MAANSKITRRTFNAAALVAAMAPDLLRREVELEPTEGPYAGFLAFEQWWLTNIERKLDGLDHPPSFPVQGVWGELDIYTQIALFRAFYDYAHAMPEVANP